VIILANKDVLCSVLFLKSKALVGSNNKILLALPVYVGY